MLVQTFLGFKLSRLIIGLLLLPLFGLAILVFLFLFLRQGLIDSIDLLLSSEFGETPIVHNVVFAVKVLLVVQLHYSDDLLVTSFYFFSGLLHLLLLIDLLSLTTPDVSLSEGFLHEVVLLVVDVDELGKDGLVLLNKGLVIHVGLLQFLVAFEDESREVIAAHGQGLRQLDGHLLLLLENQVVVLHVLFSVCLQVGSELVQEQAVFALALLAVQKVLTELGRSKTGSHKPIFVNVLIH